MRIVAADLPADGARLSGELAVELEATAGPDELTTPAPVRYEIFAERDGTHVRIRGRVVARVVARCSRCAGAFEVPVDREFEVLYESFDSGAVSRAGGLDASDLPLDYYEGDAIDGHRLLAEQILLALPMKLLCDEDCRGLCPVCGADLNHTRCGCETEIDSRLAPLKAIREQL